MRTHKLKCWPEPFEAVVDGSKRHEYRRDDRGFAVGDCLCLMEWDPSPNPVIPGHAPAGYTGRSVSVRVTYLGRGFGIPEGFVCMSVTDGEPRSRP